MDKSDRLRLTEIQPKNSVIKRYVDKYQFYQFDAESWIKTVPNARLECWKIFEGGFTIWDETSNAFKKAPLTGGFPATTKTLLFHVPTKLYCLNIKFYLKALTLPAFRMLYPANPLIELNKKLATSLFGNHHESDQMASWLRDIRSLDETIEPLLASAESNSEVDRLLRGIEETSIQSVQQLANHIGCSTRQLQRLIREWFQLTPKELLNVLRFSETTSHLKSTKTKSCIEALAFGYYDQSHFIRECKRITGVPPRKLFENMSLSTPDLMIFE